MSAEPPPLTPEQEATMHENRSVEVIVPCAVLIGLCTVVVALRFAARLFHRARLGADDWFALAALVCCRRPTNFLRSSNSLFNLVRRHWVQCLCDYMYACFSPDQPR